MAISAQNTHHYLFDLWEKLCTTCLNFQDRDFPYKHACAAHREYHLNAEDYVRIAYKLETYRKTYEKALTPFVLEGLPSRQQLRRTFLHIHSTS